MQWAGCRFGIHPPEPHPLAEDVYDRPLGINIRIAFRTRAKETITLFRCRGCQPMSCFPRQDIASCALCRTRTGEDLARRQPLTAGGPRGSTDDPRAGSPRAVADPPGRHRSGPSRDLKGTTRGARPWERPAPRAAGGRCRAPWPGLRSAKPRPETRAESQRPASRNERPGTQARECDSPSPPGQELCGLTINPAAPVPVPWQWAARHIPTPYASPTGHPQWRSSPA